MWIDLEFNKNPSFRFVGVNGSPVIKSYHVGLLDHSWWEIVPFHHKRRGSRDFGILIRVKHLGSLCIEVVTNGR